MGSRWAEERVQEGPKESIKRANGFVGLRAEWEDATDERGNRDPKAIRVKRGTLVTWAVRVKRGKRGPRVVGVKRVLWVT